MTNIAMDNGPFIVDLPIENCDVPYIYIYNLAGDLEHVFIVPKYMGCHPAH